MYFFFNDTATTEIYTLFPTRRSSDLGQFVTTPTDPDEAVSLDEEASTEADEAGGWQDEAFTTAESGYPRTDVYIDPDTGEEEVDPLLKENETLKDDVDDLIVDTGLQVRAAKDGVVELTGRAASEDDLRSEEHTSELQSRQYLVCRLLLEKKMRTCSWTDW